VGDLERMRFVSSLVLMRRGWRVGEMTLHVAGRRKERREGSVEGGGRKARERERT